MSLSAEQKKFYENTLSVTKREINDLEGLIQEELAKVKDRLAELQNAQKAALLGVVFDWIIAAVEVVVGIAKIVGGDIQLSTRYGY